MVKNLLFIQLLFISIFTSCIQDDTDSKNKYGEINNVLDTSFNPDKNDKNDSAFQYKHNEKTIDLELLKEYEIPTSYDQSSETKLYYEDYIGKAYAKNTFEKFYTRNRFVLDSLINEYEK